MLPLRIIYLWIELLVTLKHFSGFVWSFQQPNWYRLFYWSLALYRLSVWIEYIFYESQWFFIEQDKHFLMLPWIIVNGFFVIPFALLTVILSIVALPICKNWTLFLSMKEIMWILYFHPDGPVYIWWCICSAYQKVQENTPYTHLVSLSSCEREL